MPIIKLVKHTNKFFTTQKGQKNKECLCLYIINTNFLCSVYAIHITHYFLYPCLYILYKESIKSKLVRKLNFHSYKKRIILIINITIPYYNFYLQWTVVFFQKLIIIHVLSSYLQLFYNLCNDKRFSTLQISKYKGMYY